MRRAVAFAAVPTPPPRGEDREHALLVFRKRIRGAGRDELAQLCEQLYEALLDAAERMAGR